MLQDASKKVLQKLNIPIQKLAGIAMDGAPSMAGKNSGLSMLIMKDVKNTTGCNLSVYHCLIHEENLHVKSIKVVADVAKLVNCIRPKGLNHHKFEEYLHDLDSESGNMLYLWWLSRGRMLKCVYDLKLVINLFLGMKGNSFPKFTDHDWVCDFAFSVDIPQYLNELNSNLRGMNQLINKMFDGIKAFESKLQL
jgi:hypothetical protein